MPETAKVKRTRNGTSRSKGSCKTCRFRHLKCDEQKPSCQRCLRWGLGKCGGYTDATSNRSNRPNYQFLQPKLPHEFQTGVHFQNEEDHRYFQYFRHEVAPYLQGPTKNSFWEYLLVQACADEPFVLDSVIAIGALARAMSVCRDSPLRLQSQKVIAFTSHDQYTTTYEYSLRRYNTAIQLMRSVILDGDRDLRKACIACLLVFCFEMHIGNHTSAVYHAQSGISLMHQWQSKKKEFKQPAAMVRSTIEDEIIHAIGRLDMQILIFLDQRSLEFHQAMRRSLTTTLENMPRAFMTLGEAKLWGELVIRQNYHFRAESLSVGNAQEVEPPGIPPQWEDSVRFPMRSNVLSVPAEIPSPLLSQYQAYLSQWNRWSMAFRLLFTSLRASKSSDQIGATLLLIQAKLSCISLASAFSTLETAYDDFLCEFQEIIRLAILVHETLVLNLGRLLYRIDGGIIPALFFVATKCRDRVLRRQAVRLLSSSPWREGVFDSACCHKMALWIIEVEEEGLGNEDFIPEHRRLKIRKSHIDLQSRRAQLQGTQFKAANDTEPCWKETILTW